MRKLWLILMLILAGNALETAAQTVRIRPAGKGRISVSKGAARSIIDLSGEVSGCPYVAAEFQRDLNKKGCAASPATFKLVDAVTKNNQTFLVVQTEAMGGCNVCGYCGASESFALIWLALDARLRVTNKKSIPIEDCRTNTSFIGDAMIFDEEKQDETLNLKFSGDLLTVEYESPRRSEDAGPSGYNFSHLEYNRKTPENGFIIKTEKRAASSARTN